MLYAHVVQLAVLDVLYKRTSVNSQYAQEQTAAVQDHSEAVDVDDDHDCDDEAGDFEQGMEVVNDIESHDLQIAELSGEYQDIVQKIRAVVKFFKRSPTRNDALLQPYVKAEFGKEISLVLDCRTRWNSLFDVLSRFVRLRSALTRKTRRLCHLQRGTSYSCRNRRSRRR